MLDTQNLMLIASLQNRNDYSEYLTKCSEAGRIPDQILTFSQRVGILAVSTALYPDLPAAVAYQKLLDTPPVHYPQIVTAPQSKGLGDTVAKITYATGLNKLAQIYTQITGKDCGCASRQEALNKLVPYGVREE